MPHGCRKSNIWEDRVLQLEKITRLPLSRDSERALGPLHLLDEGNLLLVELPGDVHLAPDP